MDKEDKVHIYHEIPLNHKKGWKLPFAGTWVDLEIITLSTISLTEQDKYHMVSSRCRASLVAHSEESACNGGDPGLIPGLGRFPGEGNGYPFQNSCPENSTDRGTWQAETHGELQSVGLQTVGQNWATNTLLECGI